jgi:uncharacterized protein
VRVHDAATLMLPDRRGNNRVDSLPNIVRDPRMALLFMIPGIGNTLRVNGRAQVTTDGDLTASFAMAGKAPRSVIVIAVEAVYFQCARAIVRSELWNPDKYVELKNLPSAGQILAALSEDRVGGEDYDRAWPSERSTRCGEARAQNAGNCGMARWAGRARPGRITRQGPLTLLAS